MLAAETLAPMAQVRALVRKLVLEELLSGEVLEVMFGEMVPCDAVAVSDAVSVRRVLP